MLLPLFFNLKIHVFLDVKIVQPLLDLEDRTSMEAEFDLAKTYERKPLSKVKYFKS